VAEIPRIFSSVEAGAPSGGYAGEAPRVPREGAYALGAAFEKMLAADKAVKAAANEMDVLDAMGKAHVELARRKDAQLESPDPEAYVKQRESDIAEVRGQFIDPISDPLTRAKAQREYQRLATNTSVAAFGEARQMKIDSMKAIGTTELVNLGEMIKGGNDQQAQAAIERSKRINDMMRDKLLFTDVRWQENNSARGGFVYKRMEDIVDSNPDFYLQHMTPESQNWVALDPETKLQAPPIEPFMKYLDGHQRAQLIERAMKSREAQLDRETARAHRKTVEAEKIKNDNWQEFSTGVLTDKRDGGEGKSVPELVAKLNAYAKKNGIHADKYTPIIHDLEKREPGGHAEAANLLVLRISEGAILSDLELARANLTTEDRIWVNNERSKKAESNQVMDSGYYMEGKKSILIRLGGIIGPDMIEKTLGGSERLSEKGDFVGRAVGEYTRNMSKMFGTKDRLNTAPNGLAIAQAQAELIVASYQAQRPDLFKSADSNPVAAGGGQTPKTGGQTPKTSEQQIRNLFKKEKTPKGDELPQRPRSQ
jgi:hypothetical protein